MDVEDRVNASPYEEEPLVFETSDVESLLNVPVVQNEEPDVVETALDVEQSREKFILNEVNQNSRWDFLGAVELPLGRSGYETDKISETRAMKLSRIARELEEIDIDEEETDRNSIEELNLKLKKLLGGTSTQIHSSNVDETLSRVSDAINVETPANLSKTSPTNSKNHTGASTGTNTNVGKILAVESRISKIESRVGNGHQSIPAQLDDLSRKMEIVYNPEHHTDQLESRLLELNKHMETYLAQKRLEQLGGSSKEETVAPLGLAVTSEAKIEEIYSKLEGFSEFQEVLPRLLGRLRSLYEVHGEINGTVGSIRLVNVTIDSVRQEISRWDRAVNELNAGLVERETQFMANKSSIEESVYRLENRIKELEAKMGK